MSPIIKKEENWAVSTERIQHFFERIPDVKPTEKGFCYGKCQISLEPFTAIVMGKWPLQRTRICFEGPKEDTEIIYRKFFLEFLSAGG